MNENEQYHNDTTSISKSGLDLIRSAPALYHYRYLQKNKPENESTDAMVFGSAFHLYILEPEKIEKELIVKPIFKGTGSRKRSEEWDAINTDKIVVSLQTYKHIVGMRDAVINHPIAYKLLFSGQAEKEFRWIDEVTGVNCKCKPDFLNDKHDIVDLKSTEDASDYGFPKSARKFRYHVQAPFYLDGVRKNGINAGQFYFIAVEKKPPYLVNVFSYDEYELDLGRDIYREDLQKYKECKENNKWPGYEPTIKPLTVNY